MFGRKADLGEIAKLADGLAGPHGPLGVDVAICPPATLLAAAADRFDAGPVRIGAQDVFPGGDGAHTGDMNAAMLADAGAGYVIVGHSERRRDHGETDDLVRRKAEAAIGGGMIAIVCVGETIEQRKAGSAGEVVRSQVLASAPAVAAERLVVAYEPVWAIGTGLTPTIAEIAEIHSLIRNTLPSSTAAGVRLLYGGSVKPSNAAEIFTVGDVDGALVGGASLKAADFLAIIRAHPAMAR
jgi:triosephosphate isomerase